MLVAPHTLAVVANKNEINMKKSIIVICLICFISCGKNENQEDQNTLPPISSNSEKIKVLPKEFKDLFKP